ncbi:ribonucleotide-diphosphate reductase subunit beta [Lactobacillaceae bacterium Scapto_B20]
MNYLYYQAINWDRIDDQFDKYTWEQLTNNFWLDIRVPVKDDLAKWNQLNSLEQQTIGKMIAANSMFAAFQSEIGAPGIRRHRRTQQEECVLNTITFMKSVHAKSATTIFRELLFKPAKSAFDWANNNEAMQSIIDQLTRISNVSLELRKKASFILTETSLTFGKLLPILNHPELKQINQIANNILQDSAIFTAYVGYKFRLTFEELTPVEQHQLIDWVQSTFSEMVTIEEQFLKINLKNSRDAIALVHYGANHALNSLGLEPLYDETSTNEVAKIKSIMIDPAQFQQQVHAEHNQTDVEAMADDDYDF